LGQHQATPVPLPEQLPELINQQGIPSVQHLSHVLFVSEQDPHRDAINQQPQDDGNEQAAQHVQVALLMCPHSEQQLLYLQAARAAAVAAHTHSVSNMQGSKTQWRARPNTLKCFG